MHGRNRTIGSAGLVAAIFLGGILMAAAPRAAFAEPQATASPKVHELATQLAEEWLKEQGATRPAAAPTAPQTNSSFEDYVNSYADAIHDQIIALASAIPDLPREFERAAARVTAIDPDSGRGQVFLDLGIFGDPYMVATRRLAAEAQTFLSLVIFGACSFGAQWLFRKMTEGVRRRLDVLPMVTVKDRLRVIAARFALDFGAIATFALGGLGPLLGLDWDPARREMLLSVLTVCVVIWAAVDVGVLLLAPNDEHLRILPMDTVAAGFWYRRLIVFVGWFSLVWVIMQECSALDFSFEGVHVS